MVGPDGADTGRVSSLTLPAIGRPAIDRPVRIDVMVVRSDTGTAECVTLSGPLGEAVREAFAHPSLTLPLQSLAMDAGRLTARVVSCWQDSGLGHEARQTWEKSDGATIVRWWIDPADVR
jgi:hypothetical protein